MFFVQRMTSLLAMMYNEAQSLTLLDLVFARQKTEDFSDFLINQEQPE